MKKKSFKGLNLRKKVIANATKISGGDIPPSLVCTISVGGNSIRHCGSLFCGGVETDGCS